MDKSIRLEDNTNLRWFPKKHENYLNLTTLIYGKTGSGKSTLIDEIMYLCKDYVSGVFVILGSDVSSSSYSLRVPECCIRNKDESIVEWLEKFLDTQKGRTVIYNTANNISNLKSLFDKIKTADLEHMERSMNECKDQYIRKIESKSNLDFAKKKEEITSIEKTHKKTMIEFYKLNIRQNKIKLESMKHKLGDPEICSLKYLDFVPHTMLIVDDCASNIKKWLKDSTTMKEIFYNGRHSNISMVITSQDDKEIDSEIRKNATVNIFTTAQVAISNFTRASNSYPKMEKQRAELCVNSIFMKGNQDRNFKKLIYYQKDDKDKFYYTIADIYDEFKMGCPGLWEINNKIKELNGNDKTSNPFFDKYHDI